MSILAFGLGKGVWRRERTIHGEEEPAFARHILRQSLRMRLYRVERKSAHAWREFRVSFAIRNSDSALEGNVKICAPATDSDNVLSFTIRGALFEGASQGFWVWDHRSREGSVFILDESHGVESVEVAGQVEDLAR